MTRTPAVWLALLAAALFGASTPLVKLLTDETSPLLLAGLLYLGSGLGLAAIRLGRDRGWSPSGLQAGEWPWLAGAIVFGGALGPFLLVLGLAGTAAGTASLLLNLEAVLTAVLAWVVFREHADRRIVAGMTLIVAGGIVLAWPSTTSSGPGGALLSPLAIVGACLCWALDNNLTRKVSASDALFLAGIKGLVAGAINLAMAVMLGASLPSWSVSGAIMLIGLIGYGASLYCFVLALRDLGASRTGAYFSTAPFVGAAVSLTVLNETATPGFWTAFVLMAIGVWLHLSERHQHSHRHEPTEHAHPHRHDVHHQHTHDFDWDGREPHAHLHRHAEQRHSHAHFPDIHHRHEH